MKYVLLFTVVGTDYLGKRAPSRNDAVSGVSCLLTAERPYDCYSVGKGDGSFMNEGQCMAQTRYWGRGVTVSNKTFDDFKKESKKKRRWRRKIE